MFHGFSNSACEVGYMHHGKVSFQDLASTTALVQRVSQLKQEDISKWNGRKIFELAKAGDVKCEKAIQELVEALCEGIFNICCVLNPEVVILGGGIMTQVHTCAHCLNKHYQSI